LKNVDGGEISISIETTQTLDTMLLQILNQALVAVGAKAGSLMLVDERQGILQIKARLGEPRPGRKSERVFSIDDRSIAGRAVISKRTQRCDDVETEPSFAPSRSGKNFSSLLSVPIVHDGRVLAVINADAVERGYFYGGREVVLEAIARDVAAPIAARISIIDALAEVGVELARLPNEGGVERTLEKIAELAVRSLGADVVTLYQYLQDKDEFPVAGTGPTIAGSIGDRLPMRRKVYPHDVPWTVVKERRSGFYADVHSEDFLTREVQRPGDVLRPRFVDREGIKSMAALLLPFRAADVEGEEVVGVMFANYRSPHIFNIDEISALASFADYAAVAILNARHEERRQAEQMRMVESISANFAHRMSNLAGPSRVATQIIREHVGNAADAVVRRKLDLIEREADVLLALANRLTQRFTHGHMTELAAVDIGSLVVQEVERLDLDGQDARVVLDVEPDLPAAQSVEFELRQVLHDIFSNAIESITATGGSTLTVRARYDDASQKVEVSVSDDGGGIRDEIRDRLFAPGVSSKKDKLGIGLWYSRIFMQATGGDVVLRESIPRQRTTFVVQLPLQYVGQVRARQGPPPTAKNVIDILIVEDMPDWRGTLGDALDGLGYSLRTAASYGTAIDLLEANRFKLAIIDVGLVLGDESNEDGLRLSAEIQRSAPETKVVIVTHGSKHTEVLGRMQTSEAVVKVLDKATFTAQELRSVVDDALAGRK
jgi:signal transduction histidine kinase